MSEHLHGCVVGGAADLLAFEGEDEGAALDGEAFVLVPVPVVRGNVGILSAWGIAGVGGGEVGDFVDAIGVCRGCPMDFVSARVEGEGRGVSGWGAGEGRGHFWRV